MDGEGHHAIGDWDMLDVDLQGHRHEGDAECRWPSPRDPDSYTGHRIGALSIARVARIFWLDRFNNRQSLIIIGACFTQGIRECLVPSLVAVHK